VLVIEFVHKDAETGEQNNKNNGMMGSVEKQMRV